MCNFNEFYRLLGINPSELAGRSIGVYVGASSQETFQACRSSIPDVTRFDLIGASACMFANRLSYALDIRGPSFILDTYCSSSLLALHTAVMAIRSGECEGAIVAGINLLLNPLLTLQIHVAGALSEDGKCKAFDAAGMSMRMRNSIEFPLIPSSLGHV